MSLRSHPNAGWSIRLAGPDDRQAIERVFLDCLQDFPWRGSPVQQLRWMRQTSLAADTYVAEEPRAGVVGFLTLEDFNAYIPHLFVDLDWRFCGIGTSLLDVARSAAGKPLKLDVDRLNVKARAAYRSMGWKEIAHAGARKNDQVRLLGPE